MPWAISQWTFVHPMHGTFFISRWNDGAFRATRVHGSPPTAQPLGADYPSLAAAKTAVRRAIRAFDEE